MRTRGRRIVMLLVTLGALALLPADAVKPGRWEYGARGDFSRFRISGFEIDYEGHVRPGLSTVSRPLPVDYAWSLLEFPDAVYVGAGDKARILVLPLPGEGEGTGRVAWEGEGLEVYALAKNARGEVLAGISPLGRVIRFRRSTEGLSPVEEIVLPDSYVWRIVPVGDDVWIASGSGKTGTGGAIWRWREGRLRLIHRSDDPHVLSLALAGDRLYAGTQGPAGAVLAVTNLASETPGVALVFDPPQDEIADIVAAPDGSIFCVALSSSPSSARATPQAPQPEPSGEESGEEENASAEEAPRPAAPSSNGAGVIYRVDAAGRAEPWITSRSPVRSMMHDGAALYVATSDGGQVYRVDAPSRSTLVMTLDEKTLLSMSRNFIGTGRPATLHRIVRTQENAYVRSPSLDAEGAASWGVLSFEARGAWEIRTRSGNSQSPDPTWSAWSLSVARPGSRIESPSARYLQFEIRYAGSDTRDFLRLPSVTYQVFNRAPRITDLAVSSLSLDPRTLARLGRGGPLGQLVMQVAQAAKNLFSQPTASAVSGFGFDDVLRPFSGLVQVQWTAQDPDRDRLTTRIEVTSEDGTDSVIVEEEYGGTFYVVNTRSLPDGRYRVRLVVGDAIDNDRGRGLEESASTDVFLVDNTPPAVELKTENVPEGGVRIVGRASDAAGRVASIHLLADDGRWQALLPEDGICDQAEEVFRFLRLPGASRRVVVVKAVDQDGNVGYARIRY